MGISRPYGRGALPRDRMESHHLDGSGRATPLRNRMESRHPGGATRPTGILPVGKPANKTTQNPRAITVRNNHTPRADHALLHLKYVTYRAKNIRFATTGWAALVAPLGEAALSSLRGMAGGSAGRLAPPWEATGVSPPRWRLSIRPRRCAALPCGAATGVMPSSGRG